MTVKGKSQTSGRPSWYTVARRLVRGSGPIASLPIRAAPEWSKGVAQPHAVIVEAGVLQAVRAEEPVADGKMLEGEQHAPIRRRHIPDGALSEKQPATAQLHIKSRNVVEMVVVVDRAAKHA